MHALSGHLQIKSLPPSYSSKELKQKKKQYSILTTTHKNTLPVLVKRVIHRDGRSNPKIPVNIRLSDPDSHPFLAEVDVVDVIRLRSVLDGKFRARFWLYGDEEGAFLSCQVSRHGDTKQVVKLMYIPNDLDKSLLTYGIKVDLPDVKDDEPVKALRTYRMSFKGLGGKQVNTRIEFSTLMWPAPPSGCALL